MLDDATNALIAKVLDGSASEADAKGAAQSFVTAVGKAGQDEIQNALRKISTHFDHENPCRAAFLALLCGAIVENGADPLTIAVPLTKRLASLLELTGELVDACRNQMPKGENKDQDSEKDFEVVRQKVALTMEKQNLAWVALEQYWRPAIAVYSRSAEARSSARHLFDSAAKIAEFHEAGHWLQMLFKVLDKEPIVAIEPSTRIGILGRISGVVDNFQLNVLLMDSLPRSGFFARRRVAKRVADISRGIGPQQSQETVTSVWNLYTWQAMNPGLPDPNDHGSSSHWIWNEGIPEDIPIFEGRRAILVGPPSYPRSWQAQRMFDGLKADLEIEKVFTKDESMKWLTRMVEANR